MRALKVLIPLLLIGTHSGATMVLVRTLSLENGFCVLDLLKRNDFFELLVRHICILPLIKEDF